MAEWWEEDAQDSGAAPRPRAGMSSGWWDDDTLADADGVDEAGEIDYDPNVNDSGRFVLDRPGDPLPYLDRRTGQRRRPAYYESDRGNFEFTEGGVVGQGPDGEWFISTEGLSSGQFDDFLRSTRPVFADEETLAGVARDTAAAPVARAAAPRPLFAPGDLGPFMPARGATDRTGGDLAATLDDTIQRNPTTAILRNLGARVAEALDIDGAGVTSEDLTRRERQRREAYDLQSAENPAWSGADTPLVEGGPVVPGVAASGVRTIGGLAAMIGGSMIDPINHLDPVGGRGGGVLRQVARRGASGVVANTAGDLLAQAADVDSGAQERYLPEQTLLNAATGGALGGTLGLVSALRNAGAELPDEAPAPRPVEDDLTARVSRGSNDRVQSEEAQAQFEAAQNAARRRLHERGLRPDAPSYRQEYEAALNAELRARAPEAQAPAPQPAALPQDATLEAQARTNLRKRKITPRSENYPEEFAREIEALRNPQSAPPRVEEPAPVDEAPPARPDAPDEAAENVRKLRAMERSLEDATLDDDVRRQIEMSAADMRARIAAEPTYEFRTADGTPPPGAAPEAPAAARAPTLPFEPDDEGSARTLKRPNLPDDVVARARQEDIQNDIRALGGEDTTDLPGRAAVARESEITPSDAPSRPVGEARADIDARIARLDDIIADTATPADVRQRLGEFRAQLIEAPPVSRETSLTSKAPSEQTRPNTPARDGDDVPLANSKTPPVAPGGDLEAYWGMTGFPKVPRLTPEMKPPESVTLGLSNYVSIDGRGRGGLLEGRPTQFANLKHANEYAEHLGPVLAREGRTPRVEQHPSGKGFAVRAVDTEITRRPPTAAEAAPTPTSTRAGPIRATSDSVKSPEAFEAAKAAAREAAPKQDAAPARTEAAPQEPDPKIAELTAERDRLQAEVESLRAEIETEGGKADTDAKLDEMRTSLQSMQQAIEDLTAGRTPQAPQERPLTAPPGNRLGMADIFNPDFWKRSPRKPGELGQTKKLEAEGVAHEVLEEVGTVVRQKDMIEDMLDTNGSAAAVQSHVVDAGGQIHRLGEAGHTEWADNFTKRTRSGETPQIGALLNATQTAEITSAFGAIGIRVPETMNWRLRNKIAAIVRQLRSAKSLYLEVFPADGGPAKRLRDKAEIEAALNMNDIRPGDLYANPLDPRLFKKHLIDPAMKAMARYIQSFERSDPQRVAFWNDVNELFKANPKSPTRARGVWRTIANLHDTLVVSDVGALRGLARRHPQAKFDAEAAKAAGDPALEGQNIFRWLADQIGSDPGSGRVVPRSYENEGSQEFKAFSTRIDTIMGTLETALGRRLTKAEAKDLALRVTRQRGALSPEMETAAAELRRAFDDEWRASKDAGLDLGVQKNYLNRVFDEEAVLANPMGFIKAATEQYIDEGLSASEAADKARSLYSNIVAPPSRRIGSRGAADTSTVPNPTASRQWKPSADARMRDFYVNDIRKLAVGYGRRMAFTRAYARHFGAKGERLQAAYDALDRVITREDDREAARSHVNTALGVHGGQRYDVPKAATDALSVVQVVGLARFLARTWTLQLVEPMLIAARENKGGVTAFRHLMDATKFYWGTKASDHELEQLADMIGITGNAAKEMFLDARLNGLTGNLSRRAAANVMDSFGITQLTERQRVYAMIVGARALRHALDDVVTNAPNARAAADLLGEYGITKADAPALLTWVESLDALPTADRLEAIAYGQHPKARAFRGALHDFAIKSIMEPTAAETPTLAKHPLMRMAYSLTSFQHAFTREVLMRTLNQTSRALGEKGLTPRDRIALGSVFPAMLAIAVTQQIVQGFRTSVFSSQSSSEQSELERFITGWSRAGFFGNYDTLVNMISSNFRYERDPAGLASGPFIGTYMTDILNIIQGMEGVPGNSPNTNNAEWQAAKASYAAIMAPSMVGLAAQIPLPGALGPVRTVASAFATSSDASRNYATGQVGERTNAPNRRGGGGGGSFDTEFGESNDAENLD